ncbi:MAG: hypothetical protein IPO39_17550 [Bacteroidetes bacterium]|nr:hypothetical protein [Bacteroidota bacterium]
MQKSKLYEILMSFDGHDFNRAKKYLNSPFFNEEHELINLLELFDKSWQQDRSFPTDKVGIYTALFPRKKFNDKHYRYLISGLTKHLENFVTQKRMQQDPRSFVLEKQKALLQRKCGKSFQFVTSEIKQILKTGTQDSGVLLAMHDSALAELEFKSSLKTRKASFTFDSIIDDLDRFYVARKLQLVSEQINAQNVIAGNSKIRMLEEVKSIAEDPELATIPSIELYHTVFLTLTESGNEIHFEKLKQFLVEKGELFSIKEQKEVVQYLKNFCIKQINLGKTEFVEKLFEIYKLSLHNKKILRSEFMSPWEYKNIVTIGLRMKEYNWVKKFIDDYNRFLEPTQQKNALVYNLANWHFFRAEFSETLKLFQEVEFTDLYYQLDVRAILLKAYYSLGDEETFYYHASAFRSFLSRNGLVSEYQRKIYRNFVRYVVRLMRDSGNAKKLNQLLEEVREVRQIADFRWLEEKVFEELRVGHDHSIRVASKSE